MKASWNTIGWEMCLRRKKCYLFVNILSKNVKSLCPYKGHRKNVIQCNLPREMGYWGIFNMSTALKIPERTQHAHSVPSIFSRISLSLQAHFSSRSFWTHKAASLFPGAPFYHRREHRLSRSPPPLQRKRPSLSSAPCPSLHTWIMRSLRQAHSQDPVWFSTVLYRPAILLVGVTWPALHDKIPWNQIPWVSADSSVAYRMTAVSRWHSPASFDIRTLISACSMFWVQLQHTGRDSRVSITNFSSTRSPLRVPFIQEIAVFYLYNTFTHFWKCFLFM